MRRRLLLSAGILSTSLGLVGIVVPVLPTTPFLLLAAYCFARSSARLEHWLLHNRVFGRYISGYVLGTGLPRSAKAVTIALLWIGIGVSAIFLTDRLLVRLLLAGVAVGVTVHVATIRPRA